MSRCQKCNVIILDHTDRCPLCKHVLEEDGTSTEDMYPNAIAGTKRVRFQENLFILLSIMIDCLLVSINYNADPQVPWSIVAGLVFIYANIVFRLAIVGKSGYMFKTISLIILAVAMMLGIDYVTGYRGWSLDFVVPSAILVVDLVIFLLILINRRNWQSYMMTEILTIMLSLIPVILRLMGMIHFKYLVWIAFGTSLFLFLGTLILGDQRARTELTRRFHV